MYILSVIKRKSPLRNVSLSPRGRRKNVGVKINNISNESKVENDLGKVLIVRKK